MKKLLNIRLVFALLGLLTFAACGKEVLYQDLSEQDANEIIVALYKSGIEAQKIKVEGSQETTYTVAVPKGDLRKANTALVENNLPRKRVPGLREVCKDETFPTPEGQKCKQLLTRKGEIINSLQKIAGVVEADVILNIPEVREFDSETQPSKRPTASAVIKLKKDPNGPEITEAQLQRYISNGVPGMDQRDVSVIINYAEPPLTAPVSPTVATPGVSAGGAKLATLAGLTLEEHSLQRFKIYAAVMLVFLIGVSMALILNVIRLTKLRQELRVSKFQGGAGELAAGAATPLLESGAPGAEASLRSGEKPANQPQ